MKVLVINCGSSSIKFELFEMPEESVLAKGMVEKIGEDDSRLVLKIDGRKFETNRPIADHDAGLRLIVDTLTDSEHGGISDVSAIGAIGHRVVHAGEAFAAPVLLRDEVVKALEDHVDLAPLHNPPNLLGIKVAKEVFPDVPQAGVFDTAFHQTMPDHAFIYPVPYEYYTEHRVRRYGFHGTSHCYVSERAAELLGRSLEETNLITAHLGNGASITAIENGRSVDTSMGMTPLEGLVMGTRCGDIDPALMQYIARVTGQSMAEIDRTLNKKSGLIGLSGLSNDMRELADAANEGHERADLALRIYAYRLKKYIGAYTAVLGRVDALVFTGGVGENQRVMREKAVEGLELMGYAIEHDKNMAARGVEADIAAESSRSRILVIPTDEELMIARQAFLLA